MTDFLKGLNEQQYEAVTTVDRPVLVLAGAGSGKTRVITYRIAHSIREKMNRPEEIFAVTFTNKAAAEMRERVEKLLGHDVRQLWITTFHSACVRILRRYIDKLGYTRDFTIYDDGDQAGVVREVLRDMGRDPKEVNLKNIVAKISSAKSSLITPEQYRNAEASVAHQMMGDAYGRYNAILKANNAVDFDDLLILTVRLLEEHKDVREYYRNLFRHILIDEYQDTNHVQYRMMKLLGQDKKMFCAVGDDDQSIYAWRGADINNILTFGDDFPNTHVVKLERNYRSTQPILDAANRLISRNNKRNKKKLWTSIGEGRPVYFVLSDEDMLEAQWVGEQVYHWRNLGRRLDEVAVFYRTHAQSRAFEDVFRGMRIPYQIVGGIKFYDRKEVRDILAYLRVIVNPADEVCLKRILNVPVRGIGDKTIEKLSAFAKSSGLSLFQALQRVQNVESIAPKTRTKLQEVLGLIGELAHESQGRGVMDFLLYLMDRIHYTDYLETAYPQDYRGRIQNVQELVAAAEDFERKSEDITVAAYLNEVALMTDVDLTETEGTPDVTGTVSFMSLHAAKGLEFPLVFFTGMEENIFPSVRDSEDPEAELEEERRLCYVGITRAREQLFLTAARSRRMYGQRMYNEPSPFINEIQPVWARGKSAPNSHRGEGGYSSRRTSYHG